MKTQPKTYRDINALVEVMEKLLSPEGCPWDREQTPKSLTPFAIEEAFELAEAIEREDINATKEELGDVLMQVIFHSALSKRQGQFDLSDVIEGICTKLIRRHPHVFGDVKVKDSDEVLKNWTEIKNAEKAQDKNTQKGPFNIPAALPALQRAQKIGDKTKTLKFDWSSPKDVFEKVREEFHELEEAFNKSDKAHTAEELGDMFFVLAQFARHLKLEAETVARSANRKFESRFEKILGLASAQGLDFVSLSTDKKEELWELVKNKE